MQCAINYTLLNSTFCVKEIFPSSLPRFCTGCTGYSLLLHESFLHHSFSIKNSVSFGLCATRIYNVYFLIDLQRAEHFCCMPRGCFYGLENLRQQLKVPSDVFSVHPGVYRMVVKGAEMFNKIEVLETLEQKYSLWGWEAEKGLCHICSFFSCKPADILQGGKFLLCCSAGWFSGSVFSGIPAKLIQSCRKGF